MSVLCSASIMLSVKLQNSAHSNFILRASEQQKTGRVLACLECLNTTESFLLITLCQMYMDVVPIQFPLILHKSLKRTYLKPFISPLFLSRDRGGKSSDFETTVPSVPTSLQKKKVERGWHWFFMPGLIHIIRCEFLGIISVCQPVMKLYEVIQVSFQRLETGNRSHR